MTLYDLSSPTNKPMNIQLREEKKWYSSGNTPNDKYENIITSHMEVAAECILTKS